MGRNTLFSRRDIGRLGLSAAGLAVMGRSAGAGATGVDMPPSRMPQITSWAYQLQHADIAEIARSPFDLVVIDSTKDGDPDKPLKAAEVRRMKRTPQGGRRIVLAYFSVGEAEDYRFYWNEEWLETATPEPAAAGKAAPTKPDKPDRWLSAKAPPWLGDENESWGGNFQVKYWDPGWQAILFGSPTSFLERVLAQGFDGIYLDRVDAYYEFVSERESAGDDMAELVIRLAEHARRIKPDCIVVPQNGEELLLKPAYVAAIDAIAKEDLFYGSPTEGEANNSQQIANSLSWLEPATKAGRPVLTIEYLDKPEAKAEAAAAAREKGFIPYFGPRSLDKLVWPDPPAGGAAAKAAEPKAKKK